MFVSPWIAAFRLAMLTRVPPDSSCSCRACGSVRLINTVEVHAVYPADVDDHRADGNSAERVGKLDNRTSDDYFANLLLIQA